MGCAETSEHSGQNNCSRSRISRLALSGMPPNMVAQLARLVIADIARKGGSYQYRDPLESPRVIRLHFCLLGATCTIVHGGIACLQASRDVVEAISFNFFCAEKRFCLTTHQLNYPRTYPPQWFRANLSLLVQASQHHAVACILLVSCLNSNQTLEFSFRLRRQNTSKSQPALNQSLHSLSTSLRHSDINSNVA